MTTPFEGGERRQRAPHVDEILDAERLALALLPFNQVHWHFDIRRRQTQRLDQDFSLKPVAVRLDAQALEYRRAVDLQRDCIRGATNCNLMESTYVTSGKVSFPSGTQPTMVGSEPVRCAHFHRIASDSTPLPAMCGNGRQTGSAFSIQSTRLRIREDPGRDQVE